MKKDIKAKNIKVRVGEKLYNDLIAYCELKDLTVSAAIRYALEKVLYAD